MIKMHEYFSKNIKQLRTDLGLTQRAFIQKYLVDASGNWLISVSKLSLIENQLNDNYGNLDDVLAEKFGFEKKIFQLPPSDFAVEIMPQVAEYREPSSALDYAGEGECARANIAGLLCEYFTQGLQEGSLKRGEKIPSERELAKMFSLSRTVIREAIVGLTFVGFLEARQGQGTFISHCHSNFFDSSILWNIMVGEKTKSDLQETRVLLEAELAYSAARRGTDDDFKQLLDMLTTFKEYTDSGDINGFVRTDYEFHLRIAKTSQNKILFELFKTIRNLMMFYSKTGITKSDDLRTIYQEHENIIQEMANRNAEGARETMRYHINQSGKRADDREKEQQQTLDARD